MDGLALAARGPRAGRGFVQRTLPGVAAFARSSKEGQYYLMPLVLVTLPLLILPMAPGVELTLGNSLIPMTGLVLLLRQLLDGNGWEVRYYVLPVILVTGVCCLVAMRWAIDQFNTESVLFSDTERLDLRLVAQAFGPRSGRHADRRRRGQLRRADFGVGILRHAADAGQ